ncbi:MAG: hypothetical protein HYY05_04885 [Chloroflexi bacterium]|nr:hypothetical protein [Chloroflexota bacterium]
MADGGEGDRAPDLEALAGALRERARAGGRGLLIAVCGGMGCGKTTLAWRLANLLDLRSVQSVDDLREAARHYTGGEDAALLGARSYEAWRVLAGRGWTGQQAFSAFVRQCHLVQPLVDGFLERHHQEGMGAALEGINLLPSLISSATRRWGVVAVCLNVRGSRTFEERLRRRTADTHRRSPLEHTPEQLAAIRRVKRGIVLDARRTGVPVIENDTLEGTLAAALELMSRAGA